MIVCEEPKTLGINSIIKTTVIALSCIVTIALITYYGRSPDKSIAALVPSSSTSIVDASPDVPETEPKLVLTPKSDVPLDSGSTRLKWQLATEQTKRAPAKTPAKIANKPPTRSVVLVTNIKTKLQVDLGSYVVVSLKGNVSESNDTGSQEITIQAIGKGNVEIGISPCVTSCSVVKGQKTTFTFSIWMSSAVFGQIHKWRGTVSDTPSVRNCNALDLTLLKISRNPKGTSVFRDIVFDAESIIENPTQFDYAVDQNISVQALDEDGYCLGTFDLGKFGRDINGQYGLDRSATRSISAMSKKKVIFSNLELHPELYDAIRRWKVVPWSVGHPHAFLSE